MKKSTKFISLLLAVIMVFSVIPMTAFASPIKNSSTVNDLIKNDSLANIVEYLLTKINDRKTAITGTVLRLVFSFLTDNEDLQKEIGGKDVFALKDAEAAKALLDWLDHTILPALQAKLDSNDTVKDILDTLNNVTPITVKVNSVDNLFKTLTDDVPILGTIKTLSLGAVSVGDLNSLNVNALNTKRANGDLNVVYAFLQFIADNTSLIKKALTGNLDLGILNNRIDALDNILNLITELPSFIKSALYKLIDKDAEMGKFEEGKMGGDWANSAYKGFSADQLLAAALIKLINQNDDPVSDKEANEVLNLSFYGLLTEYGPVLYEKFAVTALNDHLQGWLDMVPGDARKEFVATAPTLDADTFKDIFAGAGDSGFLGQLNNIVVKIAKLVLADKTFKALALENDAGDNSKLNANLTKIARYALPILISLEGEIGYTFPEAIKKADPAKLSLADMAVYILKPFFTTWFKDSANFDQKVVDAADSLPALALLAVNYTATNDEWLHLDYTFDKVAAKDVKGISENDATNKVLATAAGIAIGALKHNADSIHFTAKVDGKTWDNALIEVENWGLDFVTGLPAVAGVHELRNANSYGPFYKVNVLLNELINFAFLNNVDSKTFKLDLEKLLKEGVLKNLYEFDIAGVIGIFQKNTKDGNVLNGKIVTSVIGIVDRILTALFEHNCGTSAGTAAETVDDPVDPCTKGIKYDYTYCKVCGAYNGKYNKLTFGRTETAQSWNHHKTVDRKTEKTVKATEKTCTKQIITEKVCTVCNKVISTKTETPVHKMVKQSEYVYKCSVCGYIVDKTPTKPDDPVEPEVPTYKLGDVDNSGKVDTSDARLALRRSINLEKYAVGSPEYIACDVDKNGKVETKDARFILRHAINLKDPEIVW